MSRPSSFFETGTHHILCKVRLGLLYPRSVLQKSYKATTTDTYHSYKPPY